MCFLGSQTVAGFIVMITAFEVGVWLFSAKLSMGTRGLASGK